MHILNRSRPKKAILTRALEHMDVRPFSSYQGWQVVDVLKIIYSQIPVPAELIIFMETRNLPQQETDVREE